MTLRPPKCWASRCGAARRSGRVTSRCTRRPASSGSSIRAAATPCRTPTSPLFEKTVKKYGGGTIATKIEYTGATGADTATMNTLNQQNAVPLITKLKDAGVTTVVAIASSRCCKALTNAATQQEYNPEWFCAEWFNCSFDYFARQTRPAAVGARVRCRFVVPGASKATRSTTRPSCSGGTRARTRVVHRRTCSRPQQRLHGDAHGRPEAHAADVPGRAVRQADAGRRRRRRR